jgi:uncharacterized protein YjbJ (UPF0337 family)
MLNEMKEKFNELTGGNQNQNLSDSSERSYGSSARYGSSQGHGSSTFGDSDSGNYSRYGTSQNFGSTPRYRSSSNYSASDYDYDSGMSGSSHSGGSGKVWIAALAGVGAGIVAGMLLAPETGKETRENLKRSMSDWGDEIDRTVKSVFGKAENLVTGSGWSLKGNWNETKGHLKQQYAQLTDEDLNYVEGKEDEFVGNLQRKLGKTKREVYDMLGINQ